MTFFVLIASQEKENAILKLCLSMSSRAHHFIYKGWQAKKDTEAELGQELTRSLEMIHEKVPIS